MRKTSTDTHLEFIRSCFFSENKELEARKSTTRVQIKENGLHQHNEVIDKDLLDISVWQKRSKRQFSLTFAAWFI